MTRRVATALLLAALASGLAAQPARPPAPWLDPDRSEPAGSRYATFPSQLAGGEVSYLIYLPPGYEAAPERRYPVVYWLHGLGGDQRRGAAFVTRLNLAIRNGRAPAMIAVLVNGLRDSFYCDSRDGRWPVESVIVKELIPHIDRAYRTLARREARAIEGYSMGGYGAAHLAFKFPEVFGLAGIMAGAALDFETVAESVRKTGRLVAVTEAPCFGSIASEVAARIQESVFDWLAAPVVRVGAKHAPIAHSPALFEAVIPQATDIDRAARALVSRADA